MFYRKLNINSFKEVQDKIVPYVVNFVTEDINKSKDRPAYNLISTEDLEKLKRDIPELFEIIREELNSEIILMSYVYIENLNGIGIHTDSQNLSVKRRIRLNWPILNSTGAVTKFYKKKSEEIKGILKQSSNGVYAYEYNINDCYEVDKLFVDVPTLMNVKELHSAEVLDHNFPRILISMRLSNEEEIYQKYFNL